jgi:hypothetical protein
MSVEYSASLGFGYVVPEVDVVAGPEDSAWETVDNVVYNYPLLATKTGGGGWSNTESHYAIFIASTVQELGQIDGVVRLTRSTINAEAYLQLHEAVAAITGSPRLGQGPEWLVVGGFY